MRLTVFAIVRNDMTVAREVASQMRAGNGREYGKWGMEEFLETKAVIGYKAA